MSNGARFHPIRHSDFVIDSSFGHSSFVIPPLPPRPVTIPSIIRRLPLNLLTLLSLALFLALATLALYGQFLSGGVTFGPQNDGRTLRCSWRDGGCLAWNSPGYVTHWSVNTPPAFSLGGLTVNHGTANTTAPIVIVRVPQRYVWAMIALTAVLPALHVRRRWRAPRRPPPGKCPHCGYDLRATPDRCPECGATPDPAPGLRITRSY